MTTNIDTKIEDRVREILRDVYTRGENWYSDHVYARQFMSVDEATQAINDLITSELEDLRQRIKPPRNDPETEFYRYLTMRINQLSKSKDSKGGAV